MSHLSVLPTVMRHADGLIASLRSLGLDPQPAGVLRGFDDERHPVAVWVTLADGTPIGWARQRDGSLALVGDLQRLSRCRDLATLITRLTRAYAAHQALKEASQAFPPGSVQVQGLATV